jgi:hypothetical protein
VRVVSEETVEQSASIVPTDIDVDTPVEAVVKRACHRADDASAPNVAKAGE